MHPVLLLLLLPIVVHSAKQLGRPNIILVLTDDQDLLLDSMSAMPTTSALLTSSAVNHFVNTPICTPSRATILSGRFAHNNRCSTYNSDGCAMHMNTTMSANPNFNNNETFAGPIKSQGYKLGYFGKYLNVNVDTSLLCGEKNSQGEQQWQIPRHWDRWLMMCKPSYVNQVWNDNGKHRFTGTQPGNYTTSVIGNATLEWLTSLDVNDPFLAVVAPHAPHLPSTPAAWYSNAFGPHGLKAPRIMGWNASGLDNHHWTISMQPALDDVDVVQIDSEYTKRQQSLLSVDDIVKALHETLSSDGRWDNTFVIFTSDHGYSLGQLRVPSHKTMVYDGNTRVPLLLKGPGIHKDTSINEVTSHSDIAATLIEWAGGNVPASMDGRSFASLFSGAAAGSSSTNITAVASRQATIIEYWSIHVPVRLERGHATDSANNTHRALRVLNDTHNLLFAEFTSDDTDYNFQHISYRELFNVATDPTFLNNLCRKETQPACRVKNGTGIDVAALLATLHDSYACRGRLSCQESLQGKTPIKSENIGNDIDSSISSTSSLRGAPLNSTLRGSQPNFILIFIDDTGWGDYSFNDPRRTDTPNLHKLATTGMVLTDFHAGASVCTPSRASLLTGRLGLRSGVVSNFGPFSKYGLPMNETTIAELLKSVGYATAMAGKWHLGHRPPHSPLHRGFDRFLGLPMSHDYGCTNHPGYDISCPHRLNDVCTPPQPDLADPSICHIGPNNPWNESVPLYDGDTIIEQPVDLTTLSDRYVDFAIDFIRNHTVVAATVNKDKENENEKEKQTPFFVYLPFNHMHVPIGNHRPSFTNTSKDRGVYGDTLLQLDESIGRLVSSLDTFGVQNNTLIILTGDNGAPSDQCEYGGLNVPWNGTWLTNTYKGNGGTGKTTTWEGGHREPGLAVWPTRIQPKATSHATLSALDILPTFAALAGVNLPPHRVIDGVDISNVLFGGAMSASRSALYHPNSGCEGQIGVVETVRIKEFKAKWRTGGKCSSCRGSPAPDVYHDPPLIFDLHQDPSEAVPLTTDDARYEKILSDLKAALKVLHESVVSDNTTVADYTQDISGKPCCNHKNRLCMCNVEAPTLPAWVVNVVPVQQL